MAQKTAIEPASLAEFKAQMERFAMWVKADVEMVCREQVRLMCRDAMTFTPPMPKGGGRGLSSAAHKAGMNKLGNDVKRIFIPEDSPKKGMPVLLRQIINSVKGNDTQGFMNIYDKFTPAKARGLSPVMRKIMEDTSWTRAMAKAKNYLSKANIYGQVSQVAGVTDNPRPIHEKYKNAVGGRWKRNQPVGGPQYFIPTQQMLEAYIAQRQLKVGSIKAGYAACLRMIPKPVTSKGVERNYGAYDAPWVDANIGSARGGFAQAVTNGKVYMTFVNMVGNINNVAKEANTENLVYGNRVRQMSITLKRRELQAIKRANRRK